MGFNGIGLVFAGIFLAVSGIPGNMMGVAMTALWGDSLDIIEWKTGERNEASVFAMQNLVGKITGAIGTLFRGLTLSILVYNAAEFKAGNISPEFTTYAWPIFILGPAFGSLLSLIPLFFIKHNKKMQEQIESDLKIRRAAKKAEAEALTAGAEPDAAPV
jgi:GPH family glycoside/pentoside/hexuronide:cation symporter